MPDFKKRRRALPRLRRPTWLLVAALFVLGTATGCGGKEDAPDDPQQPTGSSDWDQMTWDQDPWG